VFILGRLLHAGRAETEFRSCTTQSSLIICTNCFRDLGQVGSSALYWIGLTQTAIKCLVQCRAEACSPCYFTEFMLVSASVDIIEVKDHMHI